MGRRARGPPAPLGALVRLTRSRRSRSKITRVSGTEMSRFRTRRHTRGKYGSLPLQATSSPSSTRPAGSDWSSGSTGVMSHPRRLRTRRPSSVETTARKAVPLELEGPARAGGQRPGARKHRIGKAQTLNLRRREATRGPENPAPSFAIRRARPVSPRSRSCRPPGRRRCRPSLPPSAHRASGCESRAGRKT